MGPHFRGDDAVVWTGVVLPGSAKAGRRRSSRQRPRPREQREGFPPRPRRQRQGSDYVSPELKNPDKPSLSGALGKDTL